MAGLAALGRGTGGLLRHASRERLDGLMGHGTVTDKMEHALSRHRSAHHPRRMRALSRFRFGHTPLVRKLRHSRCAEKVLLLPAAPGPALGPSPRLGPVIN